MTKMFDDLHDSEAFARLRDVEKVAQSIFYNAPNLVPGVFQVPAVAEQTFVGVSGHAASDEVSVDRVRLRNERHAAFLQRLDGDDAPEVHVVIDESVLRRGSAAKREQIEHLIELSRKPSVHIGVMPLDHETHQGLVGNFEIHDTADGSVAFTEGPLGDAISDDNSQIDGLREKMRLLMSAAASGDEARALMSKLIGA